MIKLLIVDDEDFIRQGMRYTIPWEENDIKIVGEASNGEEALQLAIQLKPDIVLSDIQMPVMNGLELAKKLGELMPETKVIILTAYGNTINFTNAIDVKVSSFIIKNADSKKILDSVLKIKEELENKIKTSIKIEQLKDVYQENSHLIKATVFSRFILNQIPYSAFLEKTEKMDIQLNNNSFAMALIKTNCDDEKFALGNLLLFFNQYQPFAFFIKDQLVVLVLDTQHTPLTNTELDLILPGILPVVFGNSIAIMHSIESVADFPIIYSVLISALDQCFWNADSPYELLSPSDQISTETDGNTYPVESALISAILTQNITHIQENLDNYYQHMNTHKYPRQLFIDSVRRILIVISAVHLDQLDIDKLDDLIDELQTPKEIIDLIASFAIPPTLVSNHSQINQALLFISEHFTEDIYLEDVAKAAYLSAGYLSRIFKSETGYSFKEYIHKLRIEKAQHLICETSLKHYEIAEAVGYKDYKYFSVYFNKITGCSAKEYRTQVSLSQSE